MIIWNPIDTACALITLDPTGNNYSFSNSFVYFMLTVPGNENPRLSTLQDDFTIRMTKKMVLVVSSVIKAQGL